MANTPVHTAPACAKPQQGDFAHAVQMMEELFGSVGRAESLAYMTSRSKDLDSFAAQAIEGLHDLLFSIRARIGDDLKFLTGRDSPLPE